MVLLTSATVVTPSLSRREQNAVRLLTDEVAVRVQRRPPVERTIPAGTDPLLIVGRHRAIARTFGKELGRHLPEPPKAAEAYALRSARLGKHDVVIVAGHDERGVLFGVGRLLRECRLGLDRVVLPEALDIATAPAYPLRGHPPTKCSTRP